MDNKKSKMPIGFNFKIGKNNKPLMTWTFNGLSFNKLAIELLRKPEYVALGFDEQNKRLAIIGVDNNYDEQKYNFVGSDVRKNGVMICATDMRKKMRELVGVKLEKGGIHYEMTFEKGYGIIDLKKNIDE